MLNTFSMQLCAEPECYSQVHHTYLHHSAYFYWYTFVRSAYVNKLYPGMAASAVTLSTACVPFDSTRSAADLTSVTVPSSSLVPLLEPSARSLRFRFR